MTFKVQLYCTLKVVLLVQVTGIVSVRELCEMMSFIYINQLAFQFETNLVLTLLLGIVL